MSIGKRKCLVWLRGIKGPTLQVWAPDHVDVYRSQCEPLILGIRELADEEQRESLDQLARKYPVPIEVD